MRVLFRQTGGLAGLVRGCELDVEELAPVPRRALERLLAQAGGERELRLRSGAARGAEVYELHVERDRSEALRIELDEAVLDEPLFELIDFLQERAAPR
ncbi:MAG: protealysin inhibitor emfourin [Planctomycetota bacterium]